MSRWCISGEWFPKITTTLRVTGSCPSHGSFLAAGFITSCSECTTYSGGSTVSRRSALSLALLLFSTRQCFNTMNRPPSKGVWLFSTLDHVLRRQQGLTTFFDGVKARIFGWDVETLNLGPPRSTGSWTLVALVTDDSGVDLWGTLCIGAMLRLELLSLLKVQSRYGHVGMSRSIEKQWHMASLAILRPRCSRVWESSLSCSMKDWRAKSLECLSCGFDKAQFTLLEMEHGCIASWSIPQQLVHPWSNHHVRVQAQETISWRSIQPMCKSDPTPQHETCANGLSYTWARLSELRYVRPLLVFAMRGKASLNSGWWFGTFLFSHILGIIIPTD